ncbi:MAG: hypothetical protein J6D18_01565, partial [Erysipelotrichaceae bacterium]|nr:hypothetical protein [Erysipelotrichaceae bacterium]
DKPYQQNATLQFQSLYGNQGVNNALTVYTLNTSQTLATFGRITAPAMSVNVHVDIYASKGNLLITKSASQLDSVLFEEDGSVKEFVYAEKGLPNAQFDLQALEDIVDPLSEKVVYKKGDLVAKVTTDANGQSSVPDLYFGTYGLTETKVPSGFVLNDEMQIIEIKDEATFNKVIDQQAAIFDERQMMELKLKKVSSSDKKGIGSAVFELIADQDIADAAGNVLISQGQRIQTLTSNDKGNIRFSLDLPVAKYILKEIQAPAGHALMKEDISVDATALKEKEHTFVFEQELVNTFELLSLKIRKVDKESKEAIQDTFEFTLYEDKDCKKVIQSKTGKQGVVTFKDLNSGTYYLKETKAPQGYNGSQTVHTIQVTRQGVMYTDGDKNEKRELIVENEKKKEVIPAVAPHIFTGTHNGLIHYVFGALAMLGIMAWIVVHQKKQKKS